MFLMVFFPRLVTVPARWFYWLIHGLRSDTETTT